MSDLYCNIDCTCFFATPLDGRAGNTGEAVDRYVDRLAEAGVTHLLVNTNAQRVNYASAVWQPFWDGYDSEGPDTQAFLRGLPADSRTGYRRWVENALQLHRDGVDYPARMLARTREQGMKGFVSLRMNDVHDLKRADHPLHNDFWRDQPGLRRRNCGNTNHGLAFDYARPEVREYFWKLIVETLERFEIDGLELDFMREPKLFSKDEEAEGGRILTEWLGDVRTLVQKTAAAQNREIKLGVRVPSNPETCKMLGLDAVAWAQDRLVDLVVPTPRWATAEFDMPMGEWRELLAGTGVELAGGLEVLVRGTNDAPFAHATPEQATGLAVSVLSGGAEAVYLFNYFPSQHPDWPQGKFVETLRTMSSLSAVTEGPRSHVLTFRDIVEPAEDYTPPLPATGKDLTFSLPTGPKPPEDWQATLVLGVEASGSSAAPAVTVNGEAGTRQPADECTADGPERLRYTLPASVLLDAAPQEIRVVFTEGAAGTVNHVELQLEPTSGKGI
ncbi:MAG: glycoside hydrolase family 10 protein [Planctomycetota bacterium]|jgi:hypothetical protein